MRFAPSTGVIAQKLAFKSRKWLRVSYMLYTTPWMGTTPNPSRQVISCFRVFQPHSTCQTPLALSILITPEHAKNTFFTAFSLYSPRDEFLREVLTKKFFSKVHIMLNIFIYYHFFISPLVLEP